MKTKTTTYGERNDLSMKTWIALIRSFNVIRAKEARYIQGFDMTFGQFEVLEALYHRGKLTVGALTTLIGSTPGNVTVVLKNLQKKGYLTSERSLEDGRVFINQITPKGGALIESMFAQHVSNLSESFELFSDDELESLFGMLRRLHKYNG